MPVKVPVGPPKWVGPYARQSTLALYARRRMSSSSLTSFL